MLEPFLLAGLFNYVMVFCRVGSAMTAYPGFGEIYINIRARLFLALVITVAVTPALSTRLPVMPVDALGMYLILVREVVIGVFIGMCMRIVQGMLHVAGMIIAFQSSLASAMLFDANQGSQGSVVGGFLTLMGVTLLFTSELHHLMIAGLVQSYDVFTVGGAVPSGGIAEMGIRVLSQGFLVAVKMSAPLLVIGLLVYLAAGIMGRLMPTMQVFFVILPLQIYVGFSILALSLSAAMLWYLHYFREVMGWLFVD